MRLFPRLNQLGRHAPAITAAAHAAFEQITNSEFLTNLGNVFFCTFVSHDGGSGDYPKLGGLELAQLGDQLLRQTIGKIIFARSEEHTSELQSRLHLACRLLLDKKKPLCLNVRS